MTVQLASLTSSCGSCQVVVRVGLTARGTGAVQPFILESLSWMSGRCQCSFLKSANCWSLVLCDASFSHMLFQSCSVLIPHCQSWSVNVLFQYPTCHQVALVLSTSDMDLVYPGNVQAGMTLLTLISLLPELWQVVWRTLPKGPTGFWDFCRQHDKWWLVYKCKKRFLINIFTNIHICVCIHMVLLFQ